jgi:hypothetical protein
LDRIEITDGESRRGAEIAEDPEPADQRPPNRGSDLEADNVGTAYPIGSARDRM